MNTIQRKAVQVRVRSLIRWSMPENGMTWRETIDNLLCVHNDATKFCQPPELRKNLEQKWVIKG